MLKETKTTWQYTVHLLKAGADSPRVVYGTVYSPCQSGQKCEIDSQGDWIKPDALRKAAWDFMEKSRVIGNQHKGKAKAVPVESFIAPADLEVEGEKIAKGSWVVGVKVNDNALWKAVQDGELNAFSIGGKGIRVQSDPS